MLGAFTSIIQRIVPDPEPAPQASAGKSVTFQATPEVVDIAGRGADQYFSNDVEVSGHDIKSDMYGNPAASTWTEPTPTVVAASQVAENPGTGWAYGWGFGSLFGGAGDEEDGNREPYPDSNIGPSAAHLDDRIGPPSTVGSAQDARTAAFEADGSWPAREDAEAPYGWPRGDERQISEEKQQQGNAGMMENLSNVKAAIVRLFLPPVSVEAPTEDEKPPAGLAELPGYLFSQCVGGYTRQVPGRCPCCCSLIYIISVVVVIAVGMVLHPMEIETNFDAFMKTDTNSSRLRDTFQAAYGSRDEDRRLRAIDLYRQHDIYIAYELRDDVQESIFSFRVLSMVMAFEQSLRQLPGWAKLCAASGEDMQSLCEPGLSVVNYALPSLEVETGSVIPTKMTFDGQGRDSLPLETTMRVVQNAGLQKMLLPVGFQSADVASTRVIRSIFRFSVYCCTSSDPASVQKAFITRMKDEWKSFVEDEALPALQDAEAETDENSLGSLVHVFFDGTNFEEIEVLQTLMGDNWLAAGGMGFVFFYLLFHTQSIFLSMAALFLIMLSLPLSYVVFAVLAGTTTMSIASFLSLFLVVGLGSDVVFVYTDFWHDSGKYRTSEVERLAWTLRVAGKASIATTATTALSFFANLASVLRPLREFGVFMGLCVVLVWSLITLVFAPLCCIDERYFKGCRIGGARGGSEESSWQRALTGLTYHVHRFRRCTLLVALLLWVVAAACSVSQVEVDSGVPNIFPEDHNQNRGKSVLGNFAAVKDLMDPAFEGPEQSESVCSENAFGGNDRENCAIFWCEAEWEIAKSGQDKCKCYRKPKTCGNKASSVEVPFRAIGREALDEERVAQHMLSGNPEGLSSVSIQRKSAMAPVLLQEWETGDSDLKPMTELMLRMSRAPQASSDCGWQELCFCDTYVCQLPSEWKPASDMVVAIPNSSLRLLSTPVWRVATAQRASIDVAFGLKVEDTSSLLGDVDNADRWNFLDTFEMSQPWAQRNLYAFCTQLPQSLRVAQRNCWIEGFRDWLSSRGERFPVPATLFDSLAAQFAEGSLTGMVSSKDFMWIRGGKISATYAMFFVDVHKYAETNLALGYMDLWNAHLELWNAEASRFARGAWQTSSLWVRAEAQAALISSTVATLLIVVGLAFLGMLCFTFDFLLSLYVVIATLSVLTFLAFFIIALMAWPIGPVEVIALIVFIGYAVTYSLHIAHKYGSPDALKVSIARLELDASAAERFQRTEYALKSIGSAAMGSAATTMGCSVFLLFCTLTIFQKLGSVVFAVTIMSILTALFPLPAILLSYGPLDPGHLLRCRLCKEMSGTLQNSYGAGRVEQTSSSAVLTDARSPDKPESADFPPEHGSQCGPARPFSQQVPQPLGMRPSINAEVNRGGPSELATSDSSPSLASFGLGRLPQPPSDGANGSQLNMNDVQLAGDFNIGQESPLSPVWSRSDDHSSIGKVREHGGAKPHEKNVARSYLVSPGAKKLPGNPANASSRKGKDPRDRGN
jgi:hypothetical protein